MSQLFGHISKRRSEAAIYESQNSVDHLGHDSISLEIISEQPGDETDPLNR